MELTLLLSAFGIAYGVVLQRSGFCFSRAVYELFLLRSRDAVNGVMAGLLVGSVGFGVVASIRGAVGADAGAHLLASPLGPNILVGGALFGLGMALAGMCAVGTLHRLGEGYLSAWVVLGGMLLGALADPSHLSLPGLTPFLPRGVSLLRWLRPEVAALVTVAVLSAAWVGVGWRQGGRGTGPEDRAGGSAGLRAPRLTDSPLVGGVVLGVLNTFQMAVATPWTAGYALAALPSAVASEHSPAVLPMLPALLALNGGVVLGAMASAVMAREFRLRRPRRSRDIARALLGGMLMGMGIKLGFGCALGGFFSAIPSFTLGAWVYLPGFLAGAWAGVRIVMKGA